MRQLIGSFLLSFLLSYFLNQKTVENTLRRGKYPRHALQCIGKVTFCKGKAIYKMLFRVSFSTFIVRLPHFGERSVRKKMI